MADREKVIKGLEHCLEYGCSGCPYNENCDVFDNAFSGTLVKDALELLKEQKQALKREYMRGYDKAWDEIGRG